MSQLRQLVEPGHAQLSLRQQCQLLGLSRNSLYYSPKPVDEEDLALMRLLDQQYLRTPFYGVRRMTQWLREEEWTVNEKRIRRLLRLMGLEAIYPRPRLSEASAEHRKYPYLLKGLTINRPGQVWSTDITFIPMNQGWLYLTAVLDWFSRYVLSWRLSNTLDGVFCLEALEEAMAGHGRPEGLSQYFPFYNQQRSHQSLDYLTPAAVYYGLKQYDRDELAPPDRGCGRLVTCVIVSCHEGKTHSHPPMPCRVHSLSVGCAGTGAAGRRSTGSQL